MTNWLKDLGVTKFLVFINIDNLFWWGKQFYLMEGQKRLYIRTIANSEEPTKWYGSLQKTPISLYILELHGCTKNKWGTGGYSFNCPKLISTPSKALLFLSPDDTHQCQRNTILCPALPSSSFRTKQQALRRSRHHPQNTKPAKHMLPVSWPKLQCCKIWSTSSPATLHK